MLSHQRPRLIHVAVLGLLDKAAQRSAAGAGPLLLAAIPRGTVLRSLQLRRDELLAVWFNIPSRLPSRLCLRVR